MFYHIEVTLTTVICINLTRFLDMYGTKTWQHTISNIDMCDTLKSFFLNICVIFSCTKMSNAHFIIAVGQMRVYSYGFGYGATWLCLIFIFLSVVLLICDRESEEIFYKERPVEEEGEQTAEYSDDEEPEETHGGGHAAGRPAVRLMSLVLPRSSLPR